MKKSMRVAISSAVRSNAGRVSSSAALEVVTATALNDLFGLGLEPARLAVLDRRFADSPVGSGHQYRFIRHRHHAVLLP